MRPQKLHHSGKGESAMNDRWRLFPLSLIWLAVPAPLYIWLIVWLLLP